jgi:hypothetical protein
MRSDRKISFGSIYYLSEYTAMLQERFFLRVYLTLGANMTTDGENSG